MNKLLGGIAIGVLAWAFITVARAQEYDPKTGLNEYGETQEQAERLQDLANSQRNDYLPTVLICPAGMPFWQCSTVKGFSRSMQKGPRTSTPFQCELNAQEMVAHMHMFNDLAEGEYIKVMCPHDKGKVEETGEGKL